MTSVHPSPAYFAAANSSDGFYSRFPALFDPHSGRWQKIYIIKGGPGTGKSSFMKRAADDAERKGYLVERYYCSADPQSLDGIRIPACGIAMFDGTAPHTVDAVYPGAVEEVINLGMFFDVRALRDKAEKIRSLCAEHAGYHAKARRYLHAAGSVRENLQSLLSDAFLKEKAAGAAARIVKKIPQEREPVYDMQFVTAISVRGIVHLPTAETLCDCVAVTDGGRAAHFFSALVEAAETRGVSYVRYASPLCPKETEGICFPGIKTVYMTDRYGSGSEGAVLNTARFYDRERLSHIRSRIRFACACEEMLLEGACEALQSAGRVHDALEAHYIAAMDFDEMNTFTARFLHGFC